MAQTRVPCIGRQILNHCITREVPVVAFNSYKRIKQLETKIRLYCRLYLAMYLPFPMLFISLYGFESPSSVLLFQPEGLPLVFLIK